jgi:hypothetical protein
MRAIAAALVRHRLAVVVALLLAGAAAWKALDRPPLQVSAATRLALVVPDNLAADSVYVHAWQDAAAELGVPLEVRTASQLLRSGRPLRDVGLILPDSIHRQMNDVLVAHLKALVQDGTRLMLVYDAGVSDLAGAYHPQQSRLSELAGVSYALYGELGKQMTRDQVVWADALALPQLRIPPGKLMREDTQHPLISTQPPPAPDEELAVVGYHYGRLHYPVYATRGRYDGRRLMHAEGGGIVAGVRSVGQGQVLFVNLPLAYLKLRTDGFFLHTFLRLFAVEVAGLPHLAPMPSAEGALIMNWHIDAAHAVPAMEKLTALRAFDQGPYSMHLTAGPDVDKPGDGLGIDLAHNETMRTWVRRFVERGDEVGSHGGWIHNEFGRLVDVQDRAHSEELIDRNSEVVTGASGQPVREYSAPTGNHPAWVTEWLQRRGIHAYYFTGDIGMPPTRTFQDGHRSPPGMWAFPVLSYGALASFEEAQRATVQEADIAAWLKDLADYCARNRTVRLVYFHPPGIAMFGDAFSQWMEHTAGLVRQGSLRWMTMAQYAEFANARLQVQWQLTPDDDAARAGGNEVLRLEASHPRSLQRMSWQLPMSRYARPVVLHGKAQVDDDGHDWRVVASGGTSLSLRLPLRLPAVAQAPNSDPRAMR